MHASVDGIDVVISRTGFSSEVGFEIYLQGYGRGDELWEITMAAGQPSGLARGSPNRIRRIEGGVLDFGSDMTPAGNPLEMGMERLVDFDKPDFIGKSALEAIRAEGPRRKVVAVFMDGDAFEKNNEHRRPVFNDTGKVGHVFPAVYLPRLERNIGFALLDVAHSCDSGRLRVETAGGVRGITITSLPFVDPEKKIPRASLRS